MLGMAEFLRRYSRSIDPLAGGKRTALVIALCCACVPCVVSLPVFAQGVSGLSTGGWLHEEEARFLPGLYYFHKASEYSERGETEAAMHAWEVAAMWAMKDAQYNLGIAYFRGLGVTVDRPRGLAWLALAAERKDAKFDESLAAAWDEATPTERDRANAIWRELRERYADAAALPRAQNRFRSEINQITGSRVGMPGHVLVWTPQNGNQEVVSYRTGLEQLAQLNFGKEPEGRVDVGPLESAGDSARNASPGPDDR